MFEQSPSRGSKYYDHVDQQLLGHEASVHSENRKLLAKRLLKGFSVSYFYFALNNLGYFIDLYLISLLNNPILIGAVGLGNTWIEFPMLSLIISLNSSLLTLLSQALGKQDHQLAAGYLQKALIVNSAIYIICAVILLAAKQILVRLGYEPALVQETSQYLIFMTTGLFGSFLFDTFNNVAHAHKMLKAPIYIQTLGILIECLLSYYLIIVRNLGLTGLGISRTICEILKASALIMYLFRSKVFEKTKIYFTKEALIQYLTKKGLGDVWQQFLFTMKTGALAYFEWFFEFLNVMMMASFDAKSYAASVTASQVLTVVWCLPMALSNTLSVYVSAAMGENDTWKAQEYIKVASRITVVMIPSVVIGVGLFAWTIPQIFTADEEIVNIAGWLIIIYLISFPFDAFQYLYASISRSVDLESEALKYSVFSYYVLGLPSCVFFAFVLHFRVKGIWVAGVLERIVNCLLLRTMLKKTDFESQAYQISRRLKTEHQDYICASPRKQYLHVPLWENALREIEMRNIQTDGNA